MLDLVQVFYKLLCICIYERISRLVDSAHVMVGLKRHS